MGLIKNGQLFYSDVKNGFLKNLKLHKAEKKYQLFLIFFSPRHKKVFNLLLKHSDSKQNLGHGDGVKLGFLEGLFPAGVSWFLLELAIFKVNKMRA